VLPGHLGRRAEEAGGRGVRRSPRRYENRGKIIE
jgi:hypothetical protein